jgi:hypothetical protein
VPSRCPATAQWRIHDVLGMEADPLAAAGVTLRHFKAINTNWKIERWTPEVLDLDRHRLDEQLATWLAMFDDGEKSTAKAGADSAG